MEILISNIDTPHPSFKGVIFDFDGTIADTLPICLEAFRRAAEPYQGRLLSDAEIRATFGPCEAGSAEALAPGKGEECLASYYREYEQLHGSCREPFPGVVDLIERLRKAGLRLGMVTGKGAGSLRISLRFTRLEELFEHVETGCAHGPCKPEGIEKMLAEWNLPAAQVVYVGDAPSDVKAAKQVGVPIASVAWHDPDQAEHLRSLSPDYLFVTVEEFSDWCAATGLTAAPAR